MPKTENRFIRIEDWQGNVYIPESSGSSSPGGTTSGAGSASQGATGTNPKTDGDKVSDSSSNGGIAITVTSSPERQTLYACYLSNVPFGSIVVGARLKSSIGSGTANLVEMNTYFVDASGEELVETKLDTMNINGDMIAVANEWVNLGMITNFKGVATGATFLKVELIVLPDTGATVYFDQIAVSMQINSSGSSVDIHVEDQTVVMNV